MMMSLHTCRECRLVAVAFLNQLSTAVQPYPCVLPQPFIPLCQLCQCVSSRNSLKFNLISSVSLPIQAQIEHGKTLPTPHSSITATNLFGWPHRPSHFAKAELQPHRTVFFFCLSPSMSLSVPAEPSPHSGQVGGTCQSPTPSPNPSSSSSSSSGLWGSAAELTGQRTHTLPLEPHKHTRGAGPS